MKLPLNIEEKVKKILDPLNPFSNFSRMIKFYHNELIVEEQSFEIHGNIHLFATGKAASFELHAFKKLLEQNNLSEKLTQCVSYTKIDHSINDSSILELEGSHPVITSQNLKQTKIFIDKLKNIPAGDTLIFLLSGGASALLELPIEGMSFEQLQQKHKELLYSGKNINEMNKQRKALSQVKGGGLLSFIKTKNIIQFITCDIPNEKLNDVSSGPLLSDTQEDLNPLTIKSQSASKLILSLANDYGYSVQKVFDCKLSELIGTLLQDLPQKDELKISGGEATVEVPKNAGAGGRNTHFVLAFAEKLYANEKNRDIHILSLGTDGSDGDTDAAGAYLNYDLYCKLDAHKYLEGFNSYEYFDQVGALIKTGPTMTNVMDIRMIWRE